MHIYIVLFPCVESVGSSHYGLYVLHVILSVSTAAPQRLARYIHVPLVETE